MCQLALVPAAGIPLGIGWRRIGFPPELRDFLSAMPKWLPVDLDQPVSHAIRQKIMRLDGRRRMSGTGIVIVGCVESRGGLDTVAGSSSDSLLEETGFEPSVPLRWCGGSRPFGSTCLGRIFRVKTDVFCERDGRFESCSLQRRVGQISCQAEKG